MVLISSMHHNATMLNATSHWPRGCFCSLPPSAHSTPIQIDFGYMGQNTFLIKFYKHCLVPSSLENILVNCQFSNRPGYHCLVYTSQVYYTTLIGTKLAAIKPCQYIKSLTHLFIIDKNSWNLNKSLLNFWIKQLHLITYKYISSTRGW